MDDFADIVQIPTYARRHPDGVWDLTVACPFCSDTHRHGGGSDELPDLGPRLSHCIRGDVVRDYILVAGPKDMAKPTPRSRAWRRTQLHAGLAR